MQTEALVSTFDPCPLILAESCGNIASNPLKFEFARIPRNDFKLVPNANRMNEKYPGVYAQIQ